VLSFPRGREAAISQFSQIPNWELRTVNCELTEGSLSDPDLRGLTRISNRQPTADYRQQLLDWELRTESCQPGTTCGVPPPSFLSPVTCHLQNRFSGVFWLASSAGFRHNTSTYLDEASLTKL
jgi:hypothetical protein